MRTSDVLRVYGICSQSCRDQRVAGDEHADTEGWRQRLAVLSVTRRARIDRPRACLEPQRRPSAQNSRPYSPPGARGVTTVLACGCGCAVIWRSCAISLSSGIRGSELEPSAFPSGPYRTDRGSPPGRFTVRELPLTRVEDRPRRAQPPSRLGAGGATSRNKTALREPVTSGFPGL